MGRYYIWVRDIGSDIGWAYIAHTGQATYLLPSDHTIASRFILQEGHIEIFGTLDLYGITIILPQFMQMEPQNIMERLIVLLFSYYKRTDNIRNWLLV